MITSCNDYSFNTPLKNKATRKFLQSTINNLKINVVHNLFDIPQSICLIGLKGVKRLIVTIVSDVLLAIPAH